MTLTRRIAKLESARSICDGRVTRIVGPDEAYDDVCSRCGGCHLLAIDEVIVPSREPDTVDRSDS